MHLRSAQKTLLLMKTCIVCFSSEISIVFFFFDCFLQSHRDSPRLDKELEKMNESDDSIEKSQLHSSGEEDTQSYDIYEAHNLTAAEAVNPRFDLAFHNEGIFNDSLSVFCHSKIIYLLFYLIVRIRVQ